MKLENGFYWIETLPTLGRRKEDCGIIIAQYFDDTDSISRYGGCYRYEKEEYRVITRIGHPLERPTMEVINKEADRDSERQTSYNKGYDRKEGFRQGVLWLMHRMGL